jgi:uncharacterized protein (DUF2336 family)
MTAAPFSDGVLRLAQAPDAQRARTLLKAATELFVYQADHTRTEIAVYEELAIQLMRVTPHEDRVAIARMLAEHPEAPLQVLSMLLADAPEVAAPVIAGAPQLPDVALLTVVASGSPDHHALLAARPKLSPALVEALVRKLPNDKLPLLVANQTIRLAPGLKRDLLALAAGRPALAEALSRRLADIEDADLVDLFLDLDDRGRRRVLQALELLALREFASGRPLTRPPVPDPEAVADLAHAALSRDTARIGRHLGALAGLTDDLAIRLLVDRGGEPLAVALKATGLDLQAATRVILFSGGEDVRDYFEVKRLIDLYETVSIRSATLLVGRWRGDAGPLPARVRRQLARSEAAAATPSAGRAQRRVDRREAG